MENALALARLAARVALVDAVEAPAAADEDITGLLLLDARANLHESGEWKK
jgi:hypothetical protein